MSGILEGVRVLDFSWVIVGPRTVRYLSDQGATVIKVENADHPCVLRQSPPYKDGKSGINTSAYFAAQNPNKMSLGVDLARAEGIEIVKRLVGWADVVTESFAPGVMEKLGLGYEDMKKIRPDILFLRMNMLGAAGPRASARGYGFQLVGYSGFTDITGWPDRVPAQPFGPYTDGIAPRFAAAALLTGLIHRRRTGEGACIDLSQHESGIQFLIPILLERQITGKARGRVGNSHPSFSPHGVYPCQGKERWVAIAITNDEQWEKFAGVVGEEWANDEQFSSSAGRKRNEERINDLVSRWTKKRTPEEITELLQRRGIPAGVVQNSQDLVRDPQLSLREAIWYLDHEGAGRHAVYGQGFILSENPVPSKKAAPRLGEDTFYVCKEILGMPDEEIATLLGAGVLQMVL